MEALAWNNQQNLKAPHAQPASPVEGRKAAMAPNLLVVVRSDRATRPIVDARSLYQ